MHTKYSFIFITFITLIISACDNNDSFHVSHNGNILASDFTTQVKENVKKDVVLGKVEVLSTNQLGLIYTLKSVNIDNAIRLNQTTGEVLVNDPAIFNYEINKSILAQYEVSDGITKSFADIEIKIHNEAEPFITTWKVTSGEEVVLNININQYQYNFTVDWGDNTSPQVFTTSVPSHTYKNAGEYKIRINGKFPAIQFNSNSLVAINHWGDIAWETMEAMFKDCENVNFDTQELPHISNVKSMKHTFLNAKSFNSDLSRWDVSNVRNMNGMFHKAISFNQDLGNWDVSNVKDMNSMFAYIKFPVFGIEKWNVSNVTKMERMFQDAYSFNQDISHWDVSNVVSMSHMFQYCFSFNQDISHWDVSNVKAMQNMFLRAKRFNQDLSHWDVSKVTNCKSFQQGSGLSDENLPKLSCTTL